MQAFSIQEREQNLNKLTTSQPPEFDLLIIGGGINGAGIARDAALRGMRVCLIEANDFASGTSSRSSKLIHGGIRYLENLEFHLVFEALSERTKLFTLAPHLVHPLRFMLPLYEGGRVGMFKMGLGMWLYDALSLFRAPEMHERLSADESMERFPSLQSKALLGSYVYSDAYMDDDRLVLETMRSANNAGAMLLSYVRAMDPIFTDAADGAVTSPKQIVGVQAKDARSGKTFPIRAKQVISTVGAWTDELGHKFFKDWKRQLRPTKGVHLTFTRQRFPLKSAVVMAAESRIVFAIPRHEMVIVGTTDTDFHGDPAQVKTTPEDVTYLLKVVEQYFPGAKITADDIVGSYEGVRPLVDDGAATEGKTSREHTIKTDEHNLTLVMGGKYTTYRLISEQAVDHVLRGRSYEDRLRFGGSNSNQPLNPMVTQESFQDLDSIVDDIRPRVNFSEEELQWWVERHGPEARVLPGGYNLYWQCEAAHAIKNTMCMKLLDFYTRRVPLVLAQKDHGLAHLEDIAVVFTRELGLTPAQIAEQKQELSEYLKNEFSWRKAF